MKIGVKAVGSVSMMKENSAFLLRRKLINISSSSPLGRATKPHSFPVPIRFEN
jgi:hypothetical protein